MYYVVLLNNSNVFFIIILIVVLKFVTSLSLSSKNLTIFLHYWLLVVGKKVMLEMDSNENLINAY